MTENNTSPERSADGNNFTLLNQEVVESSKAKQHHDCLEGIDKIAHIFYLYNPSEIKKYLLTNPSLISVLQDAYCQIKQVFESQEKLSLKLCCDPDVPDWSQLSLLIHVGCDAKVEQICSLKESLDDNWWIDVYALVPNLNISVSFDEL